MKKILFMALFAVMAVSASAQYYVGGSIGYKSVKLTDNAKSTNTLTIAPEVGYNFNETWAGGIVFDLSSVSGNDDNTSLGLSVYGRYKFLNSNNLTAFVDGVVSYASLGDNRGSAYGLGLEPGVSYALSDKFSIVAKVGALSYYKYSDKAGGGSGFNVGLDGSDLSFGLYYNF